MAASSELVLSMTHGWIIDSTPLPQKSVAGEEVGDLWLLQDDEAEEIRKVLIGLA